MPGSSSGAISGSSSNRDSTQAWKWVPKRAAVDGCRGVLQPAQRIGQQAAQLHGERAVVARAHEYAGHLVHDRVGQAAHAVRHHGYAAGHRLQRGQPERLVPRRAGQYLGGAVPAGHVGAGHPADQPDPFGDPH